MTCVCGIVFARSQTQLDHNETRRFLFRDLPVSYSSCGQNCTSNLCGKFLSMTMNLAVKNRRSRRVTLADL